MKIKHLLITLGFAAATGFGLFAGLNASKAEVKEAEAATISSLDSYTYVYRFKDTDDVLEGGTYYAYHYTDDSHRNGAWHDVQVTASYYDKDSHLTCIYATNDTYANLIFSDNKGHQSDTITLGNYNYTCWNSDLNEWTPTTYTHYFYDRSGLYGDTIYAYTYTSGNEYNNANWPGTTMSPVAYSGGRIFSITLDECFDKFIFNNNLNRQSCEGNYDTAWANQNECFACWDGEDRSGSWTTLDGAFADAWIFYYMHFIDVMVSDQSESGKCFGTDGADGYFATAVDVYNNHLTDSIRSIILNYSDPSFANINARMQAWAAACHKTASIGGHSITVTGASNVVLPLTTESNNTSVVLVVVSSLSLLALGGFFFMKRKKTSL